ncbi:hypothetical protein [Undibacterium curvum]|uniref:hypothetical protein n=1 Tax=Undibacterium curvum TaxID=2762294 RepID=UPI003D12411A
MAEKVCAHTERIERLEAQSKILAEQLAENTADTRQAKENTGQIIEIIQSWQGAIRVLEAIGRVFRPLGFIAIALSAFAGLIISVKNGISPK